MKGMKGKLLKKLKTIRTIGYLKPDRILHVSALDGFLNNSLPKSNVKVQTHLVFQEEEPKKMNQSSVSVPEPEIIDVSDLMKDIEDEEMEDKENTRPEINPKDPIFSKENFGILSLSKAEDKIMEAPVFPEGNHKHTPLSELDLSSFRPPDLNSGTLFDPNLLAAFEQAVMEIKAQETERRARIEEEPPPQKSRRIEENTNKGNPLLDFEEKCPPGGIDSVILYTTGLRGIRKTFEDCSSIRFLLESFRVLFHERDVSMHSEFREELWRILDEKVVPPRLFIEGRYIGGAEEVLGLHEQGKLRPLFRDIPINHRSHGTCKGCAGLRFVICFNCHGSRKVVANVDEVSIQCAECNENGLIICPICC